MHFTIDKDVFLKGLGRIQGVVERKTTLPILSNVLIEATDGMISLTATDLEVGMRGNYAATVKTSGKITVAAKKLHEIVRELPEGDIAFRARENSWIEIRSGKAIFNLVGLPADEFPFFPEPGRERLVEIQAQELKEMIEKTIFSVSTDESKYNLNGIYFQSLTDEEGREVLRLVATDGHRLALIQRPLAAASSEELRKGLIFPRKGIVELKKMAEEGTGAVYLGFIDNNAVARKDQMTVVMRLVDGDFPDYNRVIPKEGGVVAAVNKDALLHALRRIAIFSSERSKGVKLLVKSGTLEISSSNPELGDAREELEVDYQGEEIAIGFNARYLIDILAVQNEPKVHLVLRDSMSPGLVRPDLDPDFFAVVMPMRL
jgi:DNA polymerase-3 subunit beta